MHRNLFFHLGKFIYRFRKATILLWCLLILSCTPFLSNIITPFKSTGFIANNSESANTDHFLDTKLGYNSNRFLIIYHSKHLIATQQEYKEQLKYSLSGLKNFPMKHEIIYPESNKKQMSKDKHTSYVVIIFKDHEPMSKELLAQFKATIKHPKHMSMLHGGEAIFVESVNKQTQKDLYKSDMVAAPVSIIILVLIFGTIIAALVPIILGGGCALIILTTLFVLGHLFSLSIFTLNIALLLGLCLSLDYSLFIINRFRDELRVNNNVAEAMAITLSTAGKAIFYSGLAVFISLSALLFFPINILFSIGVGGLTAVFVAVAIAITLLPAVLSVLKNKINQFPVHFIRSAQDPKIKFRNWHFWHRIAGMVVKRPLLFFFTVLIILMILGYPFLNVRYGISDFLILPDYTESRQFYNAYKAKFDQNELTPIVMVIKSDKGSILSQKNINKIFHFTHKLKNNPLVEDVNSIVTTEPTLTRTQYYELYHLPKSKLDASVRQLLKTTTGKSFTVVNIVSKHGANAPETRKLITELHHMNPGKHLTLRLTGVPVNNLDVLHGISAVFPYAVTWIMALTYLILLVLLRSLFLPFKAILMNMLSLCASYGVLVYIFQEGHLHHLLNFAPQGILDISLLIIIFCALFGFSMDYEVFLLTRIQEFYSKTKDNDKSIIFGIMKSGRIITSAAIVVIFICGSFMTAEVLMVKEFGLGIAVAIFVDAFIIRTLLVPATMALVKQWNWYLPKWLDKILPRNGWH